MLLAVAMTSMGLAGAVGAETSSPSPIVAHDTAFDCSEAETDAERPPWAGNLTQRQDTGHVRFDSQVPSEDGRRVSARTYVPTDVAKPVPTVLILSPYWSIAGLYFKEAEDLGVMHADCWTEYLLERGYAVVLGDLTGTHNSDGCFDYGGPADQADAGALVDWIAEQGFSDGNVGMYGVSHVGFSQYMAAASGTAELDAIVPVAPVSTWYSYLYDGGIHYETNMLTPAAYEYAVATPPPTNVFQPGWPDRVADTACNTPEPTAYHMQPENGMEAHYQQRHLPAMVDQFAPAVFHVHGTQDENVKMDHFTQMWEALEQHGVERKALLGPWGHAEPSLAWWNLTVLRWFEHHLKGIDTGMMDEPALTLIDQDGTERHAEVYPPADGDVVSLEAGDSGELNEGTLTAGNASAGEATYVDNPALHRLALRDAAPHRVLYTSAPLDDPLRVSGTPIAEVTASIDEPDTHLVAYLYDVDDEGEATYVTRGYLDTSYRHGVDTEPTPVPTGEVVTYEVDLHAREWVFAEDHSVQLLISSSDRCPWMIIWEDLPKCHWSGIVPNDKVAEVTLHEGGHTQLHLPTAPVSAS